MPELDAMNPEMPQGGNNLPSVEHEQEGAMAKADLHKLANYSFKLFKKLGDDDQLEAWVQAKITKAADYIASVYHYLEYEMQFSEYGHHLDNSDTLSEGQKAVLKNKLMEAKEKIKALKVKQAGKVEEARTIGGGKEETCTECGGTGVKLTMGMPVPDHVEDKIAKYKRLTKATHAAHKRLDRNKNGIPDHLEGDKAVDEELSSTGGEITRPSKGVTRHTHNPNRFTDEPHTEPKSQAKSRSASEKAGEKAMDKAAEKDSKNYEKKHPGTVTRVKDGKKVDPNAKKEKEVDEGQGGIYGQGVYEGKGKKPDFLDMDKDGNKKEPMKKAVADKKKNPFAKKVDEALKGKQKKLDVDDDGDIEADDLADLRAKKEKKVDEAAKPSAGMSKGAKSALVKKAKAGGDIGKPGKSFDKVAKAAGGGEKGEKIAAAAMWKNAHESVEVVAPQLNESVELTRIKFLSGL